MKKGIALIGFLLIAIVPLHAQDNCACCDEFHQQFDFWVGDWLVVDSLGNKLGENLVSSIEDGCIINEHWKGEKGGSGSSFNYFDTTDSTWNQLWVANNGNVLKLKGHFRSGKMILKSEVIQTERGSYYNQITWTPHADGTVSQLWEIYNQEHEVIRPVFLGIYHRK